MVADAEYDMTRHERESNFDEPKQANAPTVYSIPLIDNDPVPRDPDYGVLLEGMRSLKDPLPAIQDCTPTQMINPSASTSARGASTASLYGSLTTGSARLRQLVAEASCPSAFSADLAAIAVKAARNPAHAAIGAPMLPNTKFLRAECLPECENPESFSVSGKSLHDTSPAIASSCDSDAEDDIDIPYAVLPSDDEGIISESYTSHPPDLNGVQNIMAEICSNRVDVPDVQPSRGKYLNSSRIGFLLNLVVVLFSCRCCWSVAWIRDSDSAHQADDIFST